MLDSTLLVDDDSVSRPSSSIRRYGKFIIIGVAVIVGLMVVLLITYFATGSEHPDLPSAPFERAIALMERTPLMDSHNDPPWTYREFVNNNLTAMPIQDNLTLSWPNLQTDIPRIKQGRLGAQIWSVYVSCSVPDPVQTTMEQIDVVYQMTKLYPNEFSLVVNSADVLPTFNSKKLPSLMGMEGGHSINSSMGALRAFYYLGARYMTLTHTCSTPWAQSANENSGDVIGLTPYGRQIVLEMNRLGMMVDLSHVAVQTMFDALNTTLAPVIFSHSNAYTLCNNIRNVPDDVLALLPQNGGVVMVVFYPLFVCQRAIDESNRLNITCNGVEACVTDGLLAYQKSENACNISDVVAQIDYIVSKAGIDHVGIGSDFDGITVLVKGLQDVSTYPFLFSALIEKGYKDEDINKILSGNILRVMQKVEEVAQELQKTMPIGPP
eukprot:Phypoly_transcript_07761.p1 GENE.Phypoly_transcript_07761~~Phypoly_transcript_07761.p1  ORF type:complete len:437 (+),score=71.11 Phypoly_transcript_07761:219-1529(+)